MFYTGSTAAYNRQKIQFTSCGGNAGIVLSVLLFSLSHFVIAVPVILLGRHGSGGTLALWLASKTAGGGGNSYDIGGGAGSGGGGNSFFTINAGGGGGGGGGGGISPHGGGAGRAGGGSGLSHVGISGILRAEGRIVLMRSHLMLCNSFGIHIPQVLVRLC